MISKKVILVSILLMLVSTVSIASVTALTINTNIKYIGSGKISDTGEYIYNGKVISDEELHVRGTNMVFSLKTYKDTSTLTSSENVTVSASNINFDTNMLMGKYFGSDFSISGNNSIITYNTQSNHISNNYSRTISVNSTEISYIFDTMQYRPGEYGYYMYSSGKMYNINYSSVFDINTINNSKQTLYSSISVYVPTNNYTTNITSFNGTFTNHVFVKSSYSGNFTENISVVSYSNTSYVKKTKTTILPGNVTLFDTEIGGLFNSLNGTFYTCSVKLNYSI